MRINIPLLPICVELKFRPLRPMRMSIWELMVVVLWSGLLFAAVSESRRLGEATSFHAVETVKASAGRSKSPPYGPTALESWHWEKAIEYRAAHERVDFIAFVLIVTNLVLVLTAVLGRTIHRCFRTRIETRVVEGSQTPNATPDASAC